MKWIRKYAPVLASFLWLIIGLPVYAADTGNAVQDILLSDRFNGAMSSISWLTNLVDTWFIRIITITSFFIIISSVGKNVAAGAVCAYPQFWRKVHEAHEHKALSGLLSRGMGMLKRGGGGAAAGAQGGGGGIGEALLAIIPDLMAITEFAETDISPKQYFMKAIPEMIAAVCIGIFIYNGLYRDTLATVGTAGSNIISNLLAAADPDAMTHFLFNYVKEPENSFANDPTIEGTWIRQISQALYKKINSASQVFSTTEDGKQGLMGYCEKWAEDFVKSNRGEDSGIFRANAATYWKMTDPTVQLVTVQAGSVAPTNQNPYFSISVPLNEIVKGQNVTDDPGFRHGANFYYVQISANFSAVATDGDVITTQIEALEGTLTGGIEGLPNAAVTVSVASEWVESADGGNTTYLKLNDPAIGKAIKNAIFNAVAGSDTRFTRSDDAAMTAQGYGRIGEVQCKKFSITQGVGGSIQVTIAYLFTPVDENGTQGVAIEQTGKVTVTFVYN